MSDQLPLFDDRRPAAHDPPAEPVPARDVDEEAREFAQDPARNVVLEASAGTGKTTVLVSRYVNLLARGVDPANILAITFTRKAAAEMRERIIAQLRRAAAQATLDKARWAAIRDRLADIQISTIDAFCLALLREFPLEADLDPGFTLADETEVPRIVDQSLDRSLAIFIGRAKRDPDIALVLAQLGLARTREGLAHLLGRRLVAWDVLDRFLARGPGDITAADVCARAVHRLGGLMRSVEGGLARFLADGPVEQARYRMLARDLGQLDSFPAADDAAVRAMLDRVSAHFLKSDGRRRTGDRIYPYTVRDFPSPEAGRRHRAEALRLSGAVEEIVRAFARDLNVVLARGVRQMFAIALAEYRRALNERSVLDFSDVLQRAVELLGRMDEFSQSRYRLEGRYHHVLVDEFQDTSRKQWELVSLLVKAWGEGIGLVAQPSIFIVGDRKQSIYRFRDAEVAVLQEAGEFIATLRPGGSARRSITRSFRAVPELLAFVNDVFTELGRDARRPDDFKYDETDRFPVGEVAAGGPVLGISAAADAEQSADATAAEIAHVLASAIVRDKATGVSRPARPGDVAILFRSRTSHREFERALEARGVPTYVYKGLGFFDADEIKDMSALIRYLADPWSDLRAAAFLRSRFVRLSDAGLASLAPHLSAALVGARPPDAARSLADDDRAMLAFARAQVPGWIAQVDRVPPADLIEQILPESAYAFELRGPRRLQAWENLKKLRGLVRRIQNRGFATLARIADHLDSLTAGDESNAVLEALDAVNLMTVHAAKGLEFPIVFLVNLAKGASGPTRPMRVVAEDVSVGPFVSETDEAEKAREREETKRLLYVALTRARDRLYLATVLTKDGQLQPGRGSLAEVLPDSLKALFARAASAFDEMQAVAWTGPSERTYEFRRYDVGLPPEGGSHMTESHTSEAGSRGFRLQAEDRFEPLDDVDATARVSVTASIVPGQPRAAVHGAGSDALVGTLVHRLLEAAGQGIDEASLAALARSLLLPEERAAVPDADAAAARAARAWRAILAQPDVAALIGSGVVRREVPFSFVSPADPHRVIRGALDCLVETADGVVVLEFKTGAPNTSHEAQLALYVDAARTIYPHASVRGRLVYSV